VGGDAVPSWSQFERQASDFAEAGRRLLVGADGVAIAFLATTSAAGQPRQAPVCPIFSGDGLYLSAGAHTPKVGDLRANRRFALHAFLGANDEEFQLQGLAIEVDEQTERSAAHGAIPFPAFDRNDPIFRLEIQRAIWVYWERVGRPDTSAVRRRWVASPI
jgi:hypothetical protein